MTAHRSAEPAPNSAPLVAAPGAQRRAPAPGSDEAAAPAAPAARTARIRGWSVAIATLLFGLHGLPVPARRPPRRRGETVAAPESATARPEGEQP